MKSHLRDIPCYSRYDMDVPAVRYNRVRLALLRLEDNIRIDLPGLRHLHLLIDNETWIVVDDSLDDLPILAVSDFRSQPRHDLRRSIPARLYYYHAHAPVIMKRVMLAMDDILDIRLHAYRQRLTPAEVVPFPARKPHLTP